MARVLIVGRGAPERGGIRTAMEALLESRLASEHRLWYLNLGRERGIAGGRASMDNLRRTMEDLVALWRAAAGMEVVHIHSAFAPAVTVLRAGAMAAVARWRGAAPIVHLHGGRFPSWANRAASRALVRVVGSAVHRFAVVSRRSAEELQSIVGDGKVRVVANGVDVRRFNPGARSEAGPPVVLYVGVLSPRKGLLDLFEASRGLRREGIDHEIWLAGGVPDEGPAAADAVHADPPRGVRFLGEVPYEELPEVYARADVFCLPSWWEASPLTLLEAEASRLPVVATRVGDVEDMVEEGDSGVLVDPGDPPALEAALAKLLSAPELRHQMGMRGRKLAMERFSLEHTLDEIHGLYEEAR